ARTIECFYKNDILWLVFHRLPFNLDKLQLFRKLQAIPSMDSNNIVIPPVSNDIITPYRNTTARKRSWKLLEFRGKHLNTHMWLSVVRSAHRLQAHRLQAGNQFGRLGSLHA